MNKKFIKYFLVIFGLTLTFVGTCAWILFLSIISNAGVAALIFFSPFIGLILSINGAKMKLPKPQETTVINAIPKEKWRWGCICERLYCMTLKNTKTDSGLCKEHEIIKLDANKQQEDLILINQLRSPSELNLYD